MGILRWILAVAVLTGHSSPIFGITPNPIAAVKLFYIISGFYMALILTTKYQHSLRSFYINRFIRLYPIYAVVLTITLLIAVMVDRSLFTEIFHLPLQSIFIIVFVNLVIFGQDLLYFCHQTAAGFIRFGPTTVADIKALPAHYDIIGTAWTLGLECTFYLMVPFLLRLRVWMLLLLIAMLIIIRNRLINNVIGPGTWLEWHYRFIIFELPLFMSGMLGCYIYQKISAHKISLYLYLLISSIFVLWTLHSPIEFCGLQPLFVRVAVMIPGLFHFTKNNRLDNFIGEFSYPIYISHMLIRWFTNLFPEINTLLGSGLFLLISTMLFSLPLISLDHYMNRWRREVKSKPEEQAGYPALALS